MITFGGDNPADRALEALTEGQYVRALSLLDQLLAAEPGNASYRCWHAHCLLSMDRNPEALESARKAIELAPRESEGYIVLAWAARRLGRRQEAQDAFEMALTLTGRNPVVLAEYAEFMAMERAPGLAEPLAREAAAAQPDSPIAWRALGWTLLRLHKHNEAETCLRKALELDHEDTGAMICLADLLNRTGRPEEARQLAQDLRRDPGVADVAEQLRHQAAKRLRLLGRDDERFNRYLPPADASPRHWADLVGEVLQATGWVVAGLLIVIGVVAALRSRSSGAGLGGLGVTLALILWIRRNN